MLAEWTYKFWEHYYDWRWGIRTYAYVSEADLGYGQSLNHYAPMPYQVLFKVFDALPNEFRNGRLVDFGCGLGRVLVAAHRMGFASATGVELSSKLCDLAQPNIAGLPLEIVNQDASTYEIAPNSNVFLFYNPFTGEPLRKVLDNIEESLRTHPRPCAFIGYCIGSFEEAIQNRSNFKRLSLGHSVYPRAAWAVWTYSLAS
ncbi:MAG: class I SAM-dependent methyltransferase [Acidobacteria bacterium]|nr:class I SAM-dependent methyltransferase [Acidobacteriota bacterium]